MLTPHRKAEDNWRLPPDTAIHLVLFGTLMGIVCVMSALSRARAFGDPALFYFALWLGSLGSAALFVARWPLYRQGRFLSVGPKALTGWRRPLYSLAYALILPSWGLLGLLWWSLAG